MKLIKQGAAGLLLALGIFFLLLSAHRSIRENYTDPQTTVNQDVIDALFLGIPLTAAGGWLAWSLHQQGRKQVQQRLHSVFYQLLKQNRARITLMQFAVEAKLTAGDAKQYLDEKAKEFGATFNVSEDGEISYCFQNILPGR